MQKSTLKYTFFSSQKKRFFVEVSKNLTTNTDLKIILLDYQNNYDPLDDC